MAQLASALIFHRRDSAGRGASPGAQDVVSRHLHASADVRLLIHLRNKHCADWEKRANQAILDCTSEERLWQPSGPSQQIREASPEGGLTFGFSSDIVAVFRVRGF